MRPRAILFDLDDTLISPHLHRTIFWRDAFTEVWRQTHGDGADLPDDLEDMVQGIDESAKHFWSDPERHRTGRLDLSTARFEILNGGLNKPNRFHKDLLWAIAERCGALMFERTSLYPDAIKTLEALKAEGIDLALITNGASDAQRAKINRFELEPHFLHIQIEGEAGIGKPEPEAYHQAMAALGTGPKDCWIVGDNLEWEVAAPQRLGIYAIWRDPRGNGVLPGDTAVTPDRVVTKLTDLLDFNQ
jgi:putative hydrolase of the HAD superfamily